MEKGMMDGLRHSLLGKDAKKSDEDILKSLPSSPSRAR